MIENEKKDFAANVPLPLERAGWEAAEEQSAAEQSFSVGSRLHG